MSRASGGENERIKIIHPKWAIDEYARIFRSCTWLNPPHPPTIMDRSPRVIKMLELVG